MTRVSWNTSARQAHRGDRAGQAFTGLAVLACHRYQRLHRRVGGNLPPAQQILDRLGQGLNQRQAARDPAQAAVKAARDLLAAPAQLSQLLQQPPLLQSRLGRAAWITQAKAIDNSHFAKLADTLDRHRPGLFSYFRHRISSGPLEGLNNKIKVLKRTAYGFRDMDYFKLRLFFLHDRLTSPFPG